MTRFVRLQPEDPSNDLGPELGVFDRAGMLAASYRRVGETCHAWAYNLDDAGIERWLILDGEARARALCLMLSERRGPLDHQSSAPPDLDDMLRGLVR